MSCLPAHVHSLIQTAVWGPPSSYPPSPTQGNWEWGGWILQGPCAPSPKLWPWRLPLTMTPLSETAGGLPAALYSKDSSAAGWSEGPLDIPTPANNYLLTSQPVSCEHRGPPISRAAGQAYLPVPLPSSCLLCLLQSPALLSPWPAAVLSLPVPCTEHTAVTINTMPCLFLHEVNAVFLGALWEGGQACVRFRSVPPQTSLCHEGMLCLKEGSSPHSAT